MNRNKIIYFWENLKRISSQNLPWLWLLIGFLLLPFTFFQTVIPLAGWLAPIFLLRFNRTSSLTRSTLWMVFFAYAGALLIASRTLPFNLLGFLGNILLKGFVWMLPYAVDRLLFSRLEGWARSLVFPFTFTTLDWMLSLSVVSSSGSPAYSQDGNLILLQMISITGMWGITFLIMWCASIVNELWENGFQWRPVRGQVILFASLLGAALLYGGLRLSSSVLSSQPVKLAAITIDNAIVKDVISSIDWANIGNLKDAERAALRPKLSATADQMLARTETALGEGAKIIAWQESSAWVLQEDQPGILDRASALAKQYDAYLQISLEVITHARTLPNLRNQSILIDPAGQVLWTYNKTYPVPYDEAFVTLSGTGKLPIGDTPYGRWTTAICYDTYFPALIRQAGEFGANLLFAPTNDMPQYAKSALSMADYRAIENGFTMLRPTGSGISAVIDDRGRILASLNYFTDNSGIMLAGLPLSGIRTIYSRAGDWVAYLCAASLVILIIWALLYRKQPAPASLSQSGLSAS